MCLQPHQRLIAQHNIILQRIGNAHLTDKDESPRSTQKKN